MDFSQFKRAEVSNKRKTGGLPQKVQEFTDMKYRRAPQKGEDGQPGEIIAKFYVSNEKFAALGLSGLGFAHFVAPDGSYFLGVVADADAKYLRARKGKEKGKSFKNDELEVLLTNSGIIDPSKLKVNQFITMTQVGENVTVQGILVLKAFTLSVGSAKPKAPKAPKAVAEAAPVAETPAPAPAVVEQAAPAPAAPTGTAEDWN